MVLFNIGLRRIELHCITFSLILISNVSEIDEGPLWVTEIKNRKNGISPKVVK